MPLYANAGGRSVRRSRRKVRQQQQEQQEQEQRCRRQHENLTPAVTGAHKAQT